MAVLCEGEIIERIAKPDGRDVVLIDVAHSRDNQLAAVLGDALNGDRRVRFDDLPNLVGAKNLPVGATGEIVRYVRDKRPCGTSVRTTATRTITKPRTETLTLYEIRLDPPRPVVNSTGLRVRIAGEELPVRAGATLEVNPEKDEPREAKASMADETPEPRCPPLWCGGFFKNEFEYPPMPAVAAEYNRRIQELTDSMSVLPSLEPPEPDPKAYQMPIPVVTSRKVTRPLLTYYPGAFVDPERNRPTPAPTVEWRTHQQPGGTFSSAWYLEMANALDAAECSTRIDRTKPVQLVCAITSKLDERVRFEITPCRFNEHNRLVPDTTEATPTPRALLPGSQRS